MDFFYDFEFIRNDKKSRTVPLTKRETRILTLGLMGINPKDRFLDLGGGTGGIACEAAKLAYMGEVISLDKNEAACHLIERNKNRFGLENLKVINKESVKYLKSYNGLKFEKIFIGGSGGNLEEIINESTKVLSDSGVIAANFVTLNNCYLAYNEFKKLYENVELINLNISHSIDCKENIMLKAENPVFILIAHKENKFS